MWLELSYSLTSEEDSVVLQDTISTWVPSSVICTSLEEKVELEEWDDSETLV